MIPNYKMLDGNEAVAAMAYRLNEVIAIYPITPASTMGEHCDAWSANGKPNLWGTVPTVIEMQSEGGAAGTVHGALQTGALTTTFTASQGLLLKIPNMYKIAGELTSTVFHVAARTLATHALSIFCDHSDVMATRATGFAILASSSVQEAMDFALIAQAATLESRIPFLHFFDGFRTSHEMQKLESLSDDVLHALIDEKLIREHRKRALSSDHPVLRGTAQNPDVFFQARERVNPYYDACPDIVQRYFDQFAKLTGRTYQVFEYHGDPEAERVIILMGSGADASHATVDHLMTQGERVGVVKVRLYRPFKGDRLLAALPSSVKSIAVLDRTKEPGSVGEPLYLDCLTALQEGLNGTQKHIEKMPRLIGGRYGLSSKEFTPGMIKGIFDHLKSDKLKNHFTIGIHDDVSQTSLEYDHNFSIESEKTFRGIFYGLGSDGTVGANKNSIKIIGEKTDNQGQGYFVYDSRKAGTVTISHLRFGPDTIRAPYLITHGNFVACHQPGFIERYDILEHCLPGGTFLLNSRHGPDDVWDSLPHEVQKDIIDKHLKFYVIDAQEVARSAGMGSHINTVMQVCFFSISGILPRDQAIAEIKHSIEETYRAKGDDVVQMNLNAVDHALEHLHKVSVPNQVTSQRKRPLPISKEAPDFVRNVLGMAMAGRGDELPVSALPADGTFPTGTSQWDKMNLALEIPIWDTDLCIQCGKCAIVCPHSVIRIKAYEENHLNKAPEPFKSCDAKDREWKGLKYTIQVAPEDCTGCAICVDFCPVRSKSDPDHKAINMEPPAKEEEKRNWDFFLSLPELDRRRINIKTIRQQQIQQPLFEFSSACSGCGETPYLKLLSQLYGDRAMIANATGCSSIFGGNLPTTPWTKDAEGRGPAWANSLFEDNAEFGLGFRISIDKQEEFAKELLKKLATHVGEELVQAILNAKQGDEADIFEQRERVKALKEKLQAIDSEPAKQLLSLVDMLVKKSVWIVGGDGWAYDIGYGGLDHVLASGHDVNVLVLDTEVYSNTGGQMSKATPRGAVAKFASAGKQTAKKDLGLMAMSYGHVYVASIAMGAKDEHTLKAFLEAEAYKGPSLIIAYSHCIAHGINIETSMQNQKAAVDSGRWLLYRYHPERAPRGENPLILDSRTPKIPVKQYMEMENRFRALLKSQPEMAEKLIQAAQDDADRAWNYFHSLANP